MPKHAIDYSKTQIYKICCKDLSIKDLYVGSTSNVVKRRASHKSDCHNEKRKHFNLGVYVFIRQNGGWENWELVVVEAFPCKTSEEQRTRERYWLEELEATLNTYNPIRTHQDLLLGKKQEYIKRRDHYIEQQKIRYAANHDKIKIQHGERIQCECGDEVTRGVIARHKRTVRHIKAMEAI